uniref:Uncharacterized protein n=1 Tax=Denticeps clupeoides TaxID=299321 RepID=A0AAY4BE67_9TELE
MHCVPLSIGTEHLVPDHGGGAEQEQEQGKPAELNSMLLCEHLVMLDLKGNQVTLKAVCVVMVHLSSSEIQHNAQSTSHEISDKSQLFTSLGGNYRHCVVNSKWSLKALDNFVISDEELVENRKLPPKFKQMCTNFSISLYPASSMVSVIISQINQIQAMYCPTVIIQQWIWGYLSRKRLQPHMPHISAIQMQGNKKG